MKQHRLLIVAGCNLLHDQTYPSRSALAADLIGILKTRNPSLDPYHWSTKNFVRPEALEAQQETWIAAVDSDAQEGRSPRTATAEESYLGHLAELFVTEGLVVHTIVTEGPAAVVPVVGKRDSSLSPRPAPVKLHHLMLVNGDEVVLNRLYVSKNALAYDLIQCLTTGTPDLGLETDWAVGELRDIYVNASQADYLEGTSFTGMSPADYLDDLSDWLSSESISMYTGTLEAPAPETSPAPSTYTPK